MNTTPIEEFHAHLDVCERCRKHPFDLCDTGYKLLCKAAGVEVASERVKDAQR